MPVGFIFCFFREGVVCIFARQQALIKPYLSCDRAGQKAGGSLKTNADYKWHLPGHAELEELGFAS
jgi:hypothetical protein